MGEKVDEAIRSCNPVIDKQGRYVKFETVAQHVCTKLTCSQPALMLFPVARATDQEPERLLGPLVSSKA